MVTGTLLALRPVFASFVSFLDCFHRLHPFDPLFPFKSHGFGLTAIQAHLRFQCLVFQLSVLKPVLNLARLTSYVKHNVSRHLVAMLTVNIICFKLESKS